MRQRNILPIILLISTKSNQKAQFLSKGQCFSPRRLRLKLFYRGQIEFDSYPLQTCGLEMLSLTQIKLPPPSTWSSIQKYSALVCSIFDYGANFGGFKNQSSEKSPLFHKRQKKLDHPGPKALRQRLVCCLLRENCCVPTVLLSQN